MSMVFQQSGKRKTPTTGSRQVDEHDLEGIDNEVSLIKKNCGQSFRLIAIKVNHWNKDLSPWKAPAVFGKEDFGEGAKGIPL